ncbi:beta-glucosidase BglX [Flavobacterium sp. A45]|uniref:beta-glucosidase BglX n=1 Tax=Flavobacterium sp. A45 TaxID=1945862 RepID=UPI000984EAFA|nr:beta-glucosidase BglX [Flavobacterium sp. A45]OOG78148.1 beta-glucosidase [Flavobacterium sp. A45]
MKNAICIFITIITFCVNVSAQDAKMNIFIDQLMNKMTLMEKLGQLNLASGVGNLPVATEGSGLEDFIRKGLIGSTGGKRNQEIAVNESRLKIPLIAGEDVIHGYNTIFPIPLAMSCMWDMELIEKSAQIAATEAGVSGICWTYSPMVDICRDPRWGRIAEGAGEDPWYGSLVAKAYVKGYQGNDLSASNTILACVKHFALYGASEAGRDYNTVDMSRLSMYQDYLPPYKAAIDAGAGSLMTAFNVVDGIPATGNKWLLDDLLRKDWGFKGLVVTDYASINSMKTHGMGESQAGAARALKAGVDMDLAGQIYVSTLGKSLEEGKVTQQEIDRACRRILEAKYKLGLFDDPFKYFNEKKAKEVILCKEHIDAAREIASRSIVLLKNNKELLPLKKTGKIAVVGPLANSKSDMLGTWSWKGKAENVISILEGIKNATGTKAKVLYAKGSSYTTDPYLLNVSKKKADYITPSIEKENQLLQEAKNIADKADIIVAVLGESRDWSGEAASRSDISIPECQQTLLKEMLATGKPVVLILSNGRPLTLTWEDEHVDAVLEAWHGGVQTGNAVADVLFGDYNPSGKLTATFPRSVGQIPIYYNHKNTGNPINVEAKYSSKYLDIPNDPLYPFGHGLSYTRFEYSNLVLDKTKLKTNETIKVKLTVTNIGKRDGEEIVQLYLRDLAASISRPVKELKGYKKVMIPSGKSKEITFDITSEDLAFWNKDLVFGTEPGAFDVMIGSSSADIRLKTTIDLEN